MKSIFRKIAFVLALAMVVTMFPVMNASAANNGNKYVRSKNATLYVGGDANGDYESCWAASAKGKKLKTEEKYKIEYVSSNPEVATVSKYGLVEAKNVGSTTITVTFTKKGEETIEESFNVIVRKNAVNIALDKESQDTLSAGLTAGDKVTLKAVQTDADGSSEGITDTVKFYCSSAADKEIIELNKDNGELTALKDGKATVVVQSCQYEYDRETKKYKTTVAAKAEYSVEVKAAGMVGAKQVNWNTVAITCGNAAAAADIVANKTNLTATYKFTDTDQDNIAYINYTEIKVDSSDDKVVIVPLHSDLVKDYVYTFKYGEKFANVKGADLTAVASIEIDTKTATVGQLKTINVKYYDINHIELPQIGMTGLLRFEVSAGDTEYFTFNGNQIYFIESGKSATVKAFYTKGYRQDGTPEEIPSQPVVIRSVEEFTENKDIVGWLIDNNPSNANDGWRYSSGMKEISVSDQGRKLYGKYTVTLDNGKVEDRYLHNTTNAIFEYTSTNDSILMVSSFDGTLYPVAAGNATVIVRRVYSDTNKPVVGTCEIRVVGARSLANFTTTPSKNRLAINSNARVKDSVWIGTKVVDQLGADDPLKNNVNYTVKVLDWTDNLTLTFKGANSATTDVTGDKERGYRLVTPDGGYSVEASGSVATGMHTVRFSITAQQGTNGPSITRVVALSIRDVTGAQVTRRELELSKSNIDMNIRSFAWGDKLNKLQSDIRLVEYDANGFKVDEAPLTLVTSGDLAVGGGYKYALFDKDNKNISSDLIEDGATPKFSAVTVSGTAVSGGAITKCNPGIYTIRVYQDTKMIGIKNISVTDTGANAITVMAKSINGANPANLKENLNFYRDGKKIDDTANFQVLPVVNPPTTGNGFYVSEIEIAEKISVGGSDLDGFYYTYKVKVGRTFYFNN